MKIFEIHITNRSYQEKHLEFFSEFFVLLQQRGLKWQKRDFNTFKVVQYAILRVPSDGFRRIITQMIGLTERNNWNLFPILQKRGWKWGKRDSVHLEMCPDRRLSHPWWSKLKKKMTESIDLTERNIWNFRQNFSSIPFSTNAF